MSPKMIKPTLIKIFIGINLYKAIFLSSRRKDHPLLSNQESFTMDNGKETIEKAMEFKYGLMERDMKGIGKITKPMVKANLFMLTEMFMKENGGMIKLMGLEFIFIQMERPMKDIGRTITKMVKAYKIGLMGVDIKDSTKMGKKMEKVIIHGVMEVIIKDFGQTIKYLGMVSIVG